MFSFCSNRSTCRPRESLLICAEAPGAKGEGMTSEDGTSGGVENQIGGDGAPQIPPWVCATLADLAGLDFEAPAAESQSADSTELGDLFRTAAGLIGENRECPDTPASRIFSMLSAVTGMHFRPQDSNEPFGAMAVFADGREQFDTARHAFVYAWFVSEFTMLAEQQCYFVLEMALRRRPPHQTPLKVRGSPSFLRLRRNVAFLPAKTLKRRRYPAQANAGSMTSPWRGIIWRTATSICCPNTPS